MFRLAPAFVLSFRLRTDDGRPVENPTVRLVWGEPPQQALELLSLLSDEDADGRLTNGLAHARHRAHGGHRGEGRRLRPVPATGRARAARGRRRARSRCCWRATPAWAP